MIIPRIRSTYAAGASSYRYVPYAMVKRRAMSAAVVKSFWLKGSIE